MATNHYGPVSRPLVGDVRIAAHLIDVEVDMYPSSNRDFITVGMPDTAVRESRERVKSALINSGFGYPSKRVTINLAPANVRKEDAGFDLPMALGILGAMQTPTPAVSTPTRISSVATSGTRGFRGFIGPVAAITSKMKNVENTRLRCHAESINRTSHDAF